MSDVDVCGAVCGNQRCELGEACSALNASAHVLPSGTTSTSVSGQSSTSSSDSESQCCPADCPVVVQSCSTGGVAGLACSGHGSCLSGTGVCRCFTGYTSDACDSCAAQYAPRTDSNNGAATCVLLPGSLSTCTNGVRGGREVGVDCGGVCPPCAATSSSVVEASIRGTVMLVSVIISTTALVALVGAGALVWFRRRKASRRQAQHGRRISTVCVTSAVYPHARAYDDGNGPRRTSDGNLDVSRRGSTDSGRREWTGPQGLSVVPVPRTGPVVVPRAGPVVVPRAGPVVPTTGRNPTGAASETRASEGLHALAGQATSRPGKMFVP